MAITRVNYGSYPNGTLLQNRNYGIGFTPSVNNKLVLITSGYLTYGGSVPTIVTVSQANVSWAKITHSTIAPSNEMRSEIWFGTPSGTPGTTLTIAFDSGNYSGTYLAVYLGEYSGVYGSQTYGVSTGASTTNVQTVLTNPPNVNGLSIGFVSTYQVARTFTNTQPGYSQLLVQDSGHGVYNELVILEKTYAASEQQRAQGTFNLATYYIGGVLVLDAVEPQRDKAVAWEGATGGAAYGDTLTFHHSQTSLKTHKAVHVYEIAGNEPSIYAQESAGQVQGTAYFRGPGSLVPDTNRQMVVGVVQYSGASVPVPVGPSAGYTIDGQTIELVDVDGPPDSTRTVAISSLAVGGGAQSPTVEWAINTGTSQSVATTVRIIDDSSPSVIVSAAQPDGWYVSAAVWTDTSSVTCAPQTGWDGYGLESVVGCGTAGRMSVFGGLGYSGTAEPTGGMSSADPWSMIAIGLKPATEGTGPMPTLTLPPERRVFFADADNIFSIFRDPDSVLDYVIDWGRLLDGDTINATTWEYEGPTMVSESYTTTTTTTKISGIGGEAKNTIVTAGGRTHIRRIRFIDKET